MDRKRVVLGWAVYDWANSAYSTTVATALLPPFFAAVVAKGGLVVGQGAPIPAASLWGYAVSLSAALVFLLTPVLGSVADTGGSRKGFLMFFCFLGGLAALAVSFAAPGAVVPALVLFVAAQVSFSAANAFYDAFLPQIAPLAERDRVSALGYAFGYVGGGLNLALALALITLHDRLGLDQTTAVRLSMALAALWWLGFASVSFRMIPRSERPGDWPLTAPRSPGGQQGAHSVHSAGPGVTAPEAPSSRSDGQIITTSGVPSGLASQAARGIRDTLDAGRQALSTPGLRWFLLAYFFYNDGIQTVISMATLFGKEEVGLSDEMLVMTLLAIQAMAFLGTRLYAALARWLGTKAAVLVSLASWTVVALLSWKVHSAETFMALGLAVGLTLGGSQSMSRSLFSQLIPTQRSTVYFGFYSVLNKLSAVLGPLVFAVVRQVTGSSRPALLSLVVFFAVGLVIVPFVRVPSHG